MVDWNVTGVRHFKHQLPPRNGQYRAIEGEGYFAAEGRGDIVQHADAGLGFELRNIFGEVGIAAADDLDKSSMMLRGFLMTTAFTMLCIGKKLQRTHGGRCGQPGSNSVPLRSERQRRSIPLLPPTSRR